ncbi:hypothetical protein H100_02761, partial [Trichophyton rubrum MR850]
LELTTDLSTTNISNNFEKDYKVKGALIKGIRYQNFIKLTRYITLRLISKEGNYIFLRVSSSTKKGYSLLNSLKLSILRRGSFFILKKRALFLKYKKACSSRTILRNTTSSYVIITAPGCGKGQSIDQAMSPPNAG